MGRAAAPLQVDPDSDGGPCYFGVIKSYNERRGFGFVACEETARIFGRDVYLSKEEASQLAKEPIVSGEVAPAPEEGQPPLKEGDFVSFQVQRSTEGYPQALNARRLRRLRGSVVHGTLPRDGAEGKIVVNGDGREGAEAAAEPDQELQRLLGAEVRVRQADCGQLRLVPGDEVIFCCQAAREVSPSSERVLEAQLVELLWTPRTVVSGSGSILGCFTLELPRTLDPSVDQEETKEQAPPAMLDGHALVDRVVLAGLPVDLEEPELMRLFSKLGATEAMVSCPECDLEHTSRFASVSFSGPVDVARMLTRAAHTINAQGCTQLARLLPHRDGVVVLPALPMPTLAVADGGALLVQWQQVGLAAGYLVELRPKGQDAPWVSVGVASGKLEDSDDLPAGLLGPQCTACRVNCLLADTPYEARVMYYTSWGCRSQASVSSAPCSLTGADGEAAAATGQQIPLATPAPPMPLSSAAHEPPSPAPLLPASLSVASVAEPEVKSAAGFQGAPMPLAESLPPAYSSAPAGPLLTLPSASQLPSNAAAASALSATTPGWRAPSGSIIPPPCAPELIPYEEASRSVCIQWPTVVHATAYTVELLEEGTASAERFTRAVPEILPEALVELRVGNLNPGAYAACVRCVAPCGCESAPSAWSFLPPLWLPPPPAPMGLGGWPVGAPAQVPPMESVVGASIVPSNQPAYLPTQTLLATNPSGGPQLPPPPFAPPSWPAASPPIAAAPAQAVPTVATAEDEALVLD